MGVYCWLIRLSDQNIEALIREPELYRQLATRPADRKPSAPPGWFARLLGLSEPERATQLDPREPGDACDLDKAWHGIHYLLTGRAEPFDVAVAFIFPGGTIIKRTIGEYPPRAFTSTEAAAIDVELRALDRDELHRRYDPKAMDELKVYPNIWVRDGDEGFNYLWEEFEILHSLVGEAHRRNQGFIVQFE